MLLNEDQKREMERFLINNSDIFAWSVAKMSGISPTVICHSLNVNLIVQPVKLLKQRNKEAFES